MLAELCCRGWVEEILRENLLKASVDKKVIMYRSAWGGKFGGDSVMPCYVVLNSRHTIFATLWI